MPYPLALQPYTSPEWFQDPPAAWERRLREISPVHERIAHLRFRYFAPRPHWFDPDRGMWALYSCTPRGMVSDAKAAQYANHWSEMPTDGERIARKATCSSYQHFMWHVHGVVAEPFWIFQGVGGGTPAKYSRREQRLLDAEGWLSDPFPLGTFPPCPFDERSVPQILERDRLANAGYNLDALEKLDRPAALKAADEEAERAFRETWLKSWAELMQPQAEFMKSYLGKSESYRTLPDAPEGLNDAVAQWKEHYVEHGAVIGAHPAASRSLSVAIP